MLGLSVLLPQRFLSFALELVGEHCMDVVALFIKRGESLFRGGSSLQMTLQNCPRNPNPLVGK
jgi:hypothetical protein